MAEQADIFVRKSSGLIRAIPPYQALAFAAGVMNMGCVSVYLIWGQLLYPGANFFLFSWVAAVIFPTILIYILFAIAMPRSGGEYLYTSRTLGPGWGLFASWSSTTLNSFIWNGIVQGFNVLWGIPVLLMQLGLATHDSSLWNLGTRIANPADPAYVWLFVVAMLFITFGNLLHYLGAKAVGIVSVLNFITYTALLATWLLIFVPANPLQMIGTMEAQLGINFQKDVVQVAEAVPGAMFGTVLSMSIFGAMVYVGQNLLANTIPANFCGELKSVSRSQWLSQIGSTVYGIVYFTIGAWLIYHAMGLGNYQHLAMLSATGDDIKLFGTIPSFMYLSIFATGGNMTLPILSTVLFMISMWGSSVQQPMGATRNMFAYSMDGLFPGRLSEVDSRGSPWILCIIYYLVAVFCGFLFLYTPYLQYIAYSTATWFVGWVVLSVAAIAFPYMKTSKGIWEKAPPVVRARFLGVPVLVICGVLGVIFNAAVAYASFLPAFTGGVLQLYPLLTTTGIAFVFPWIVYGLCRLWNKQKGINIMRRFAEIPPD
jgi:amino acid transporter